ncbi:MAG: helix-turn-helix domain-containing protein [Planctomycetota bacterium]|jgi:transcriptional regulator with XRE-family HTH domain
MPKNKKNTLGETLYAFRTARQWTQLDLAKRAGVTRSYVTHLELDNRNPSICTLKKLALAFRIPWTALVVD